MDRNTKRILAIGRGANEPMIAWFAKMTGKESPRICLLPTAVGDHPERIAYWKDLGPKLGFEPHVQELFISSFHHKTSFEEFLMSMDAIYVGGGNTVNMLAIWRAQGIDVILRQAWEEGILLGGGSAGGICWFENGLTDSRPIELTAMDAMGWLKGSFAPHYLAEPDRRKYYHQYILNGELSDGYGCDEPVGLYFENEELSAAYTSTPEGAVFKVEKTDGQIHESQLPTTCIKDLV